MRLLALILAFVALVGAAPRDWTRTVTNVGGAYVVGNPQAKVRVTEFTSYTCSHCATFAREGQPLLMALVRTGRVAFEVRNAVRDKLDYTAAVAARCSGGARFIGLHDAIFAAQGDLMRRMQAWETAQGGRVVRQEPSQMMKEAARASGLVELMAKRGVTPAALNACFANKASIPPVINMTRDAWEVRKIAGTPAFLVNGEPVQASNFDALEPLIQARLGSAR